MNAPSAAGSDVEAVTAWAFFSASLRRARRNCTTVVSVMRVGPGAVGGSAAGARLVVTSYRGRGIQLH